MTPISPDYMEQPMPMHELPELPQLPELPELPMLTASGSWQCGGCGMYYPMYVDGCACQVHRWTSASTTFYILGLISA